MSNKEQRIWTDEQIAIIRIMYEYREPISKIADKFGVSKNSIVGVIWRHIKHYKKSGINVYRSTYQQTQQQQQQQTRGFKHMIPEIPSKDRIIQRYAPPATFISFEPRTYIPKNPIPMQELTEASCREVIGDPKNMMCCGEPIVQGSYCKHHAEINYKPHTVSKILTKGAS